MRHLLLQPGKPFVFGCSDYTEDSKALGSTSSVAAALTSQGFPGEEVSLSVLGAARGCFGSHPPSPSLRRQLCHLPSYTWAWPRAGNLSKRFLTFCAIWHMPVHLSHTREQAVRLRFWLLTPLEEASMTFCPRSGQCNQEGQAAWPWRMQGQLAQGGSPMASTLQGRLEPALLHRFLQRDLEMPPASSCGNVCQQMAQPRRQTQPRQATATSNIKKKK